MNEEITWSIIDKYFNEGIKQIFKDNNPVQIIKEQDEKTKEFKLRCNLYLGGKEGDKLYYGKPMIYDDNREHYMYPNEARLRNMTYGITIHYDIEVDFFMLNQETQEMETSTMLLEKILLGRF